MTMTTRTEVGRHDLIRVHGARENNLKDVSVEIPKRWLRATPRVPLSRARARL